MSYSLEVKEKATQLRKKGYSLNEISKKLNTSKSTASLWLNNISLNENAQKRLIKRRVIGLHKTFLTKEKKKQAFFDNLKNEDINEIKGISFKSELYRILSSLLFWCEGSKGSLTRLGFTNSDPQMVKCFLFFLRKSFDLDERKFRGVVHLHSYHDEGKQINFWSTVTGLPVSQFTKSYKKKNTGKRIREDYQGCISIRYYDAKIAKKLWSCYHSLQTYLGV